MPDSFFSTSRAAAQAPPPRRQLPNNEGFLARILQELLHAFLASGSNTSFQRAFVALLDPANGALRIPAALAMPQEFKMRAVWLQQQLDGFDHGVTGRVLRSGMPCSSRDSSGACFWGTPIVREHELVGVLAVGRDAVPPAQSDPDMALLVALTGVTALCLEFHSHCQQCEALAAELRGENATLKLRLTRQAGDLAEVYPPHGLGTLPADRQQLATMIQGQNPAIQEIRRQVSSVAPTKAAVLLLGEPGVGKSLVAEVIHSLSERKQYPFIKVDCAALGSEQLEIELLGTQPPQSALQGADGRPGRLEEAHNGTLYLHEVSELPLSLQAKLLQIMQDKVIRRMGENRSSPGRQADVRILTSSSHELFALVQQERFRADLYYRLNVFPIHIPPLRERTEDIPRLLNHFLRGIRETCNRNLFLTPGALKALGTYRWPGNVREMEDMLQHLAILAESDAIDTGMLLQFLDPESVVEETGTTDIPPQHGPTLQDMERSEILSALRRNDWIQHRAARDLGITQRQMGYRVRKYKLEGIIAEERAKLRQRKQRG